MEIFVLHPAQALNRMQRNIKTLTMPAAVRVLVAHPQPRLQLLHREQMLALAIPAAELLAFWQVHLLRLLAVPCLRQEHITTKAHVMVPALACQTLTPARDFSAGLYITVALI